MVQRVSSFVRALVAMLLSALRALPPHTQEDDELHALEPDDAEFGVDADATRAPAVTQVLPPPPPALPLALRARNKSRWPFWEQDAEIYRIVQQSVRQRRLRQTLLLLRAKRGTGNQVA
jgi:hypothetical protein